MCIVIVPERILNVKIGVPFFPATLLNSLERLATDEQYLLTPPAKRGMTPKQPRSTRGYGGVHYRIDTVFGQLTDRFYLKRVRARNLWNLASCLYRKVLAHTLVLILNMGQGNPPLQLDRLVQA